MPFRIVELIIPQSAASSLDEMPAVANLIGRWDVALRDDDLLLCRMLVDATAVEGMLDDLQARFSDTAGFRVMMFSVEAMLPRIEDPPSDPRPAKSKERISREEIYDDVAQSATLTNVFVAQVVLATLVAAVGLMRNDTAILIGAMVIAPLLGPNMALCLATTLGDGPLAFKSLKANFVGMSVAFVSASLIGLLFPVSLSDEAIASRTQVFSGDIVLALASGCAGVLAFTTGVPSALIGVMVAVALLPPFVVFAMLFVSGQYDAASGALMLVATNVICVNLAGTLTFLAQGLHPNSWWEAKRAKAAVRLAVSIWLALLVALMLLLYLEFGS